MAMIIAVGIVVSGAVVCVPVLAQTVGSIQGTVTDSAGSPLRKARVSISGPSTTTVETGDDGTFTAPVAPGIYSVTVSDAGFESAQNGNVVVTAGQPANLSIALANASLTTIGRVSRSVVSINTTPSATQTVSAATFLSQGQNQVNYVLDQTPGIEIIHSGGGNNEPGSNASISIRGAQPYESQILIDGHPVNTAGNGAYGFNSTFINALLLQSVEVGKGPGNLPNQIQDAVGGTVNFRTAAISAKPTFAASLGYDSFDGNFYAVKFSDTFFDGKLGLLVGAARNRTPGYLGSKLIFGGDNNYEPMGIPVYPDPANVFGPGQSYVGVLNFAYPATSDFGSNSQLVKLAYNFSPQTSIQFSVFATQTLLDETGNNDGNIYATIVPCINDGSGASPAGPSCPPNPPGDYSSNYTANPYLGYVGSKQAINYYAAYPNTIEFDNEPIYTGEFRTVLGPGSLLARYYAGSIQRTVSQFPAPYAISPCYTPACPWVPTAGPNDNGYPGEPYIEPTVDILHGFDAQYSLLLGKNTLTFGFDRHVDLASFYEEFSVNDPTNLATFYQLASFPGATNVFQSLSYSVRGDFELLPSLGLDFGLYESNTSYVGTRFDPRGGFTFKINPDATVRLSAGSAFVAPYQSLIIQKPRTSNGTITLPSTSFAPETSMSYDLGTDVKITPDTLISADLYNTNIFNRYATVTIPESYTYNGKTYGMVTQNGNQANVRNEGFEFNFVHQPKVGLGFHAAVDLLRDYAYNQTPTRVSSIFYGGIPANNVQLPFYPYSKMRGDLTYTFANTAQVRFSSTSYGANNAFGQSGFTVFDAAISTPLQHGLSLNIGGTNIFNHDNYQTGGIYAGGTTYPTLSGGVGPEDLTFFQPRTLYIQLSTAPARPGR